MVDISHYIAARLGTSCLDPKTEFLNYITKFGIKPPHSLVMGRIDRVDGPEDKPNKKSGWYVYNEIPDKNDGHIIGIASFGDWKTDINETWCSKSEQHMSHSEREHYFIAREAMKAAQAEEESTRHKYAAERAAQIWSVASDCVCHPYLERKGVKAHPGVKMGQDGRLIIPMVREGEIKTLEYIFPNGDKRRLTGGDPKGAYFKFAGTGGIYIAEGYATGASIHEATGWTVYCCFSSGNMYEVAASVLVDNQGQKIIICGDDDKEVKGNPGRTKAEQVAQGLGLEVVFAPGFKDFNDLHAAQGLDSVKNYLQPKSVAYEKKQIVSVNTRPPGILGDIYDYYNATSGNQQPGFAVQTALAICSVILGRSYKTSFENYPSLFLLNVGKSGTGKEHAKTVVENILFQCNHENLIAGDGYTSAGAVFSALLDRPKHISVIDEFGRYLEAGRDMKGGNHNQREANTKLMESIGRAHSVIRPPTYSTMTVKKDQADEMKNRQVFNPSITLLTMTTPETLFKTLDMGAIKDGFVNRFIISISDAQRSVRKHMPPIAVPMRISEWVHAVTKRHGRLHSAADHSMPVIIEFSQEALDKQNEFQQYCVDKANYLERFGMAELPGRSNEMAMRLSLICALAKNPLAVSISGDDMEWSIQYIKSCLETTVNHLKVSISSSQFEGDKKEILADLRNRGKEGITWSQMQKNAPYSRHKQKDLRDIMGALKDADLAVDEPHINEKGGRPTIRWVAIK